MCNAPNLSFFICMQSLHAWMHVCMQLCTEGDSYQNICIMMHYTRIHCTTLNDTTINLQHVALHFATSQYITLHCVALHCVTSINACMNACVCVCVRVSVSVSVLYTHSTPDVEVLGLQSPLPSPPNYRSACGLSCRCCTAVCSAERSHPSFQVEAPRVVIDPKPS